MLEASGTPSLACLRAFGEKEKERVKHSSQDPMIHFQQLFKCFQCGSRRGFPALLPRPGCPERCPLTTPGGGIGDSEGLAPPLATRPPRRSVIPEARRDPRSGTALSRNCFPQEGVVTVKQKSPGQRYLGSGGGWGWKAPGGASPSYSPGLRRPFWIPKFLSPKGAERTLITAGCGRPSRSTSPTTPPPQFGALQVSPSLLTWSPVAGLGSARPRLTPSPCLVHLSPGRIAQIYKLGEEESPPEQQGG